MFNMIKTELLPGLDYNVFTADFQAKDQSPSPLQTSLLWGFMDASDRRRKKRGIDLLTQQVTWHGPCLVGLRIDIQGRDAREEKLWKYTWETAKIK